MYFLLVFCAILTYVGAADDEDPCRIPLDMGKTPCKGKRPEIRYHFDEKAHLVLAFEYTGCGGNKNNFKSESECRNLCLGVDGGGCPGGINPLPKPSKCLEDKDCGPKGSCQYFFNELKVCCDKSIVDKFEADWNPKCPKGKKVYEIPDGSFNSTVIGKNCKSKFCPTGAICMEGNYFATCCK